METPRVQVSLDLGPLTCLISDFDFVFPHLCSVILAGSRSCSLSSRLAPIPSITALPPQLPDRQDFGGDFPEIVDVPIGVERLGSDNEGDLVFLCTEGVRHNAYIEYTATNRTNSLTGRILGEISLRLSTYQLGLSDSEVTTRATLFFCARKVFDTMPTEWNE
ncbi:unnamed protein product [Linum trigynum]|uniref:Uncharacterized protein n=1 Tax=Linum trigynum TaxID=586398 RepID=A0AAV2EJA2_9ROSI